jgi:dienelactone hydrolase
VIPRVEHLEPALGELEAARELFGERGFFEKPESYHATPPALESPSLRKARTRGLAFEHLTFESAYEPHPDEPGAARWLGYAPCRTAHAWVLRHPGATQRPWLVCIHGYQMGSAGIDLLAFRAAQLHHRLGVNLLLPVLPLHGPRKIHRVSGTGFLGAVLMDTVHAVAQGMWDIRRLLSWVRAQGATRVGAYGLSLGGYHTALLACLDEDLACAIPGIPATDLPSLVWRHGPELHVRMVEDLGVLVHDAIEVAQVISPLVLQPRVPKEHRAIFGGIRDQMVPPEQVHALWEHWDRPRVVWYPGGHLTFRAHAPVEQLVRDTLQRAQITL